MKVCADKSTLYFYRTKWSSKILWEGIVAKANSPVKHVKSFSHKSFESLVDMREIYFFCPTTEIRVSKLLLNGIQIPNPYRGGGRALG